ncbi:MAG TPA: YdjY domain-containing protein [Phycisphaerae bacterium]|nr:YdjY domain-containing protein [Phycisphaerae bacterium]HRW53755.1 YdjY domain-containing protein [Phycisphaerae bacterium]
MARWLVACVCCLAVGACTPSEKDERIAEHSTEPHAASQPSSMAPATSSQVEVKAPDSSRVPEAPENDRPSAAPEKGRSVPYKPGITLNYEKLQVEVESQVVLRKGELELLAWSRAPVPKEHETILMVDAAPSDVYEALGLIGLTPGEPPRFDPDTMTARAATGDRVDVFVRYREKRRVIERSICDWAIDKSKEAPLAPRSWVFCGSFRTEKGTLAADVEGTLVTVVDFPSSLLSLAETHSESNTDLWLVANHDAIPAERTRVTLIFRAADNSTRAAPSEPPQ